MKSFSVSTKIVMGSEGMMEIFQGMQKVLIVTDKFMQDSGKVSYVTKVLEESNIEYEIFSEVKPDPDIDTVAKGAARILEFKPQAVIAFGGGSPIDAAKAILYFATRKQNNSNCKFVAIPTTSGTGSEVTRFAVISDKAKNAKYPLVEDSLLPDYSVLEPELIVSVPPSVTADTGVDVLTHGIEAMVANNANDFTDAAAEKAIRLVRDNLIKAYENPGDLAAREHMHNGSCLAGIAFSNSGLGLNHGMAHTLGAHFHIPHGRANGILLPFVIAFNTDWEDESQECYKKYHEVAKILKVESYTVKQSSKNLINFIRKLLAKLQVPATIKEAGVSEEDFKAVLDDMVKAALADRCTGTNPRNCTYEEVKKLFQKAYYG
ncbi:alcohol dehydrogenase [Anaerocolumna cellulosilytica]|uniref:Alcohol dehydrogenase n=1 Tax=Anaerocolumna cellulosilytica TaxID=433286 RepID=A0A6S6R7K0_9FIRM|nr:1-propanol dehydrogenase PduQ [Anaerocolumna cellulosilytica]MBB5193796.1 alcohol dehydrogenase class IV [Anaerocolumna cellulosilytica]BCJ94988.1 alcohol dehydrogenase [Anaerocolumna cellulosilytica]